MEPILKYNSELNELLQWAAEKDNEMKLNPGIEDGVKYNPSGGIQPWSSIDGRLNGSDKPYVWLAMVWNNNSTPPIEIADNSFINIQKKVEGATYCDISSSVDCYYVPSEDGPVISLEYHIEHGWSLVFDRTEN